MQIAGFSFVIVGAVSAAFPLPTMFPPPTVQQTKLSVTNLGGSTVYVATGTTLGGTTATTGSTEVDAGDTVVITLGAGTVVFAAISASGAVPLAVAIGN
jgi:hypothetical protein